VFSFFADYFRVAAVKFVSFKGGLPVSFSFCRLVYGLVGFFFFDVASPYA